MKYNSRDARRVKWLNLLSPISLASQLRLPEIHDIFLQLNDHSQDARRSEAFKDVAASYLQ